MANQSISYCSIIPSRFGSTRLPGKPLVDFLGKPMIQHVYESAKKIYPLTAVATDDERIFNIVESFGGKAVMTGDHHLNGTSRVHEAYQNLGWQTDYIVNVQGDEPLLSSYCLQELNDSLANGKAQIATLISKVRDEKELFGESEVFVVRDRYDVALYFSRSIIPSYHRLPQNQWLEHGTFYKHIGLYAYRPEILSELVKLQPGYLEISESLEQNRWLENGFKVMTAETKEISYPVDTEEDVTLVRELMSMKNK